MATGAETGEIDALLGLDRVAEILGGISPRNVRNRIYGGELRSVKLGGRRLVRQSDLREYIERLGDE
jgi:excisionase family DNA binding protein